MNTIQKKIFLNIKRWHCEILLKYASLSSLTFLAGCIIFLKIYGYLPYPFFFDASNSFGDLYSVAFFSSREGRYTEWGSVYPPINFYLARVFIDEKCLKVADWIELRTCDKFGISNLIWTYAIFFFTCIFSLYKQKIDSSNIFKDKISNKFLLFVVVCCSFPVVFGFERGNLIIIPAILLAIFMLSNDVKSKAILLSLCINFKPYLAILLIPYILRKNTIILLYIGIATISIFVITMLLVNDLSAINFISNILIFQDRKVSFSEVFHYTSILAIIKSIIDYNGIRVISPDIILCAKILYWIILGACISTAFKVILKAKDSTLLSNEYLQFYILVLYFVMSGSSGSYSLILLIPFLIMFVGKFTYLEWIALFFVLSPLDLLIIPMQQYDMLSYFSGHNVKVTAGIDIGFVYRPLALLIFFAQISTRIIRNK